VDVSASTQPCAFRSTEPLMAFPFARRQARETAHIA
jgi:hypothetical protein